MKNIIVILLLAFVSTIAKGQKSKFVFPLKDAFQLKAYNVLMSAEPFKNKQAVKVTDIDPENETELRIVKIPGIDFHNGTIEIELSGEPMKNSGEGARGFVGVAFRIDSANSKFECIYLRPTNGRAEDQVRRNHSVQYISYPEFPWYKLREAFPQKYESYVDLEAGKWTKVKIEVAGSIAKLFVHDATQPTLIISDLKQGENLTGSIGLWIGPGTEAHFRKLVVTQ